MAKPILAHLSRMLRYNLEDVNLANSMASLLDAGHSNRVLQGLGGARAIIDC